MSEKYPKLKFGEITVQHEDNWIKQAFRYFNYDTKIDPTATIVILFHDTNEVVSTMDIVPDKTIVYTEPLGEQIQPYNIKITSTSTVTLHKRSAIIGENNSRYLKGFSDIYNNKFKIYLPDPSVFNCIYYVIDVKYPDLEKVVFSIFKRKYGTDSSRFLFSYDHELITKQQAENIIYRLLTNWV